MTPVRNAARLLLTVDLVAYTWAGLPWLVTVAAPLLLVTGLLAVAGWRLRHTRGPALTAVGALAALGVLLLMWAYEKTPLPTEPPAWHPPARSVLLAAIVVCLVLAMGLLSRPAAAGLLRANLGGIPGHRFRARDAASGAVAGAGCAAAIVGIAAAVGDAAVVAGLALVLLPLAAVSAWLGWRLWRGAAPRPTAVLVVGGFTAICALVALPATVLFGALDLPSADGLRTALGGAAFVGMAGQLVVLNGLFRRTTGGWLLPAAPTAANGGVRTPA